MKKIAFSLIILILISCSTGKTAREKELMRRTVYEFATHPNWRKREEKRRHLIDQAAEVTPLLWEACDTDYFEQLFLVLTLLQDIQAYTDEKWDSRRQKIYRQTLRQLKKAPPSQVKSLMDKVSLFGEATDVQHLTSFLDSPSQEIREHALATIYRLGFPYQKNKKPQEFQDKVLTWSQTDAKALDRENVLWRALKNSDDPVYRQVIAQGLTHYVVAHPRPRSSKGSSLWALTAAETDPNVRVDLVLLIGVLGDQRIQNYLLDSQWLQSPDPNLRVATSWALNQLGLDNPQPK